MAKLTEKQEYFCQMVLQSESYSEAYRKAYDTTKMKHTTVNRKAFELMENGKITARLSELKEKRNERLKYDADKFLLELVDMLDADILDIFDSDHNCILPMEEWPAIWRKLVTQFTQKPISRRVNGKREVIGYSYQLKTIDKARILQMIGRHVLVGAFAQKQQPDNSLLSSKLDQAIRKSNANMHSSKS